MKSYTTVAVSKEVLTHLHEVAKHYDWKVGDLADYLLKTALADVAAYEQEYQKVVDSISTGIKIVPSKVSNKVDNKVLNKEACNG